METNLLDGRCRCCGQPMILLARLDIGPGMAVCPRSGQLHQAGATAYELISDGPPLARREPTAVARSAVRVDLSKEGYA
jgi:hypothetical protein